LRARIISWNHEREKWPDPSTSTSGAEDFREDDMMTRRQFQTGALGAGVALATHDAPNAQTAPKKREIVDAQVHLWKANTPDRPWAPGALQAQLPEPMTIERVKSLMDEAGVDRIVIVPPTLEGYRYDYGQEAGRRYPGRFATMARVNFQDPKEADRLQVLKKEPNVLGIRMFFAGPTGKWLTDGTADWFWPAAEKAGLPLMFLTVGQTPLFAAIAEKHPGLQLIVDHMGVMDVALKDDSVGARIAETAALAKYPNVSASPLISKEAYPWRDVTPHIKRLFDAFGPKRSFWGTDLTNTFALGPYRQRITHFTEELPFLSEDDKDWVMGKAIVEKLRWT
jgi:predicted TIM-barrel fold metal-dependent hydrolase